ncbi:MAG: hypothetical protein JSU66_14295, partial [Deltaproteobacteria bacterium]
ARVLDRWSDPTSDFRQRLEQELPAATGFSPEVVREGLARALADWNGEALHRLVANELGAVDRLDAPGPVMLTGFGCTAVLLAGSLPTPTLIALLAPLLVRSPVLAKTSSHDAVTAPLFARSIAAEDPGLGDCIVARSFPSADEASAAALLTADCIVATGSDETVAGIAARVRGPRRLITYGHRLSVAAVDAGTPDATALDDAARALALDVSLWDQQGCLSPVAVYAVRGGREAAERFASLLAAALERTAARLPHGRIPPVAGAALVRERAEAELRAAAGRPVALHAGADLAWTVVCEEDARARPAPLHRFVRVHPVSDAAELCRALQPLAAHLACVGVSGFGPRAPTLARALADLGASRVCPVGAMQAPPLDWRHDGRPVLLPMARLAGFEAGP